MPATIYLLLRIVVANNLVRFWYEKKLQNTQACNYSAYLFAQALIAAAMYVAELQVAQVDVGNDQVSSMLDHTAQLKNNTYCPPVVYILYGIIDCIVMSIYSVIVS